MDIINSWDKCRKIKVGDTALFHISVGTRPQVTGPARRITYKQAVAMQAVGGKVYVWGHYSRGLFDNQVERADMGTPLFAWEDEQ